MAKVTVNYPYEGAYVDPDDMRSVLEALASGINSVDATQLTDGSIFERHIADEQVTLAKLKGGQFIHLGSILNANGKYPGEDTVNPYEPLYFDGGTGTYHTSKLKHNTWTKLACNGYELRAPGGSPLSFTPPINGYAILLGNIRLNVYGASNSKAVEHMYVAVYDSSGVDDPSDVSRHIAEVQTGDTTDTNWVENLVIAGMYPVVAGKTYTLSFAMKPIIVDGTTGSTTCNAKVYTPPKNVWAGVLIMPRL